MELRIEQSDSYSFPFLLASYEGVLDFFLIQAIDDYELYELFWV